MFAKARNTVLCLLTLYNFYGLYAFNQAMVAGQADDSATFLGNTAYAALVDENGHVTSLPGLSGFTDGLIYSCAFNGRNGLFGGQDNNIFAPIVAIVSSTGSVQYLTPFSGGIIRSVDINSSGLGIIAGGDDNGTVAYAAFVSTSGELRPIAGLPPILPTVTGEIFHAAINESGNVILGGQNGTGSYAGLVSSSGAITTVTGIPSTGIPEDVAINDNGVAMAGGRNLGMAVPYAVVIPTNGVSISVSGIPASANNIRCVSMNNSVGLIAGRNGYAALVSLSGNATALQGIDSDVLFLDAAINESGAGIIGGRIEATTTPYAALVSPGGGVTPLSGLPSKIGYLNAVAINNAGVGVIAGRTQDSMFAPRNPLAALVAPNGTLTFLSGLPTYGDLLTDAIADIVVPNSVGPYTGSIYALLSASKIFTDHAMFHHKHLWRDELGPIEDARVGMRSRDHSMIADSSFGRRQIGNGANKTTRKQSSFDVWGAPFYDYIHQGKQGSIPEFNSQISGALAGIDYWATDSLVIGGGFAYAFDYAHYGQSLGHTKINQEMAVLYASFQGDYIFVDASAWGAFYQFDNIRHIPIISVTSKGESEGWLLSPHLELSFAQYRKSNWFLSELFAMVDWVNNWQKHYTEKGSSGFNLVVDGQYNSLLRSEAGLRLYQILRYSWGRVFFEEKGSYINQAPFHFNSTMTAFVSSPSFFPIATGSNSVQNMGGVQFQTLFLPWNDKYPYGSIGFEGEFGPTFQSYLAEFQIGKKF